MRKSFLWCEPAFASVAYLDQPCGGCGRALSYPRNYFMIHDGLWRHVNGRVDSRGMLCIPCVERRLGRKLYRDDFTDCEVNAGCFGFDISRFEPRQMELPFGAGG
ncbi:hypothetical protein [Reyranella sp.]|uniref:hypothetical protein n=1 Tax=Reyranella sp. TaxID=1929291 RepID=UPI0037852F15